MNTDAIHDAVAPQAPVDTDLLINGEAVRTSDRIEVRNPARPQEIVGTAARATPQHAADAIAAAKAAFPRWSARTYRERAEVISRCLDASAGNVEERTVLYVRENGKCLREAKGEIEGTIGRQRIALELADGFDHPDTSLSGVTVRRIPYGVVVSIVPWNAPIGLAFTQVTAALLAGNCVVLKPPETCPLTLVRSMAMFAEHLPPGVLNLLTGLPDEIGDVLTGHPDVAKIGFTGSIPSATRISMNAAATVKSLTLELGGNDPAIILNDADLERESMDRLAGICFRMAGQVCLAVKRIYVAEAIEAHFLQAFNEAVDALVVGDGLKPIVSMGPLHSEKGLLRARRLVKDAQTRGGRALELGAVDSDGDFQNGYFMRPTVVSGLDDDAPLVSEEQFSPIVPVLTFASDDEAISRANSTIFGLGASVWSRDAERAGGIARRLDAGTVWINAHGTPAVNVRAPYGGIKQSGNGRKSGRPGIEEFSQMQTISVFA